MALNVLNDASMEPATQAEWSASTGGLTRPFHSGESDRSSRSSPRSNLGTRVFLPDNTTFPTTSFLTWRSHFRIASDTTLPIPGPSNKASNAPLSSPPRSTTFPSGSANPLIHHPSTQLSQPHAPAPPHQQPPPQTNTPPRNTHSTPSSPPPPPDDNTPPTHPRAPQTTPAPETSQTQSASSSPSP